MKQDELLQKLREFMPADMADATLRAFDSAFILVPRGEAIVETGYYSSTYGHDGLIVHQWHQGRCLVWPLI